MIIAGEPLPHFTSFHDILTNIYGTPLIMADVARLPIENVYKRLLTGLLVTRDIPGTCSLFSRFPGHSGGSTYPRPVPPGVGVRKHRLSGPRSTRKHCCSTLCAAGGVSPCYNGVPEGTEVDSFMYRVAKKRKKEENPFMKNVRRKDLPPHVISCLSSTLSNVGERTRHEPLLREERS